MKRGFRIKEAARERGMTLSGIAGRLGIPRSNMSAIASGARGVSLKVLYEISRILDCGIDELILQENEQAVFKDRRAESALEMVERSNFDGIDKTWVNRVMLAQNAHYSAAKRAMP